MPTIAGKRATPNPSYLKTHPEVARYFKAYILDRFGGLMVDDLDYDTVTPLLEDIRDKWTCLE